jgi:16S rRNA (cytosine1402-N4)-methyltransferase
MTAPQHVPVLLDEVVRALVPEPWDQEKESFWLDGTLGMGGHATAILMEAGPKAKLIGLDKDGEARLQAEAVLRKFESRVRIVASGFEEMKAPGTGFLSGAAGYDGILLDLGVSSLQLDRAERGFSFSKDAPLDMRLDPSSGLSAADWIGLQDEASLRQVLRDYGEEPRAGAIARSILKARPRTTLELAGAVLKVGWPHRETHPATKTFQAIRIAVNDELEALRRALPQALSLLKSGGRLAVISFHSLEDRIVKNYVRTESTDCLCPPSFPECRCGHKASLRKVLRKAVVPGEDEVSRNPRSRSAKLRVAEKI